MAHFNRLTWRQHLAYLSCAIALALSSAAYQKVNLSQSATSRVQSQDTIALLTLRRSVKRLREKVSAERDFSAPRSRAGDYWR
ncbi:hypothetical protein [Oscillatoria sp. FACHB-1406]|uniref:hypothetical protein n=1 Tax=Oscillatoria sp. FACHB-1406 TaxID=2692846 RepID=UPI001688F528|nr:hypothetical protein [Oscillatoria sp. FACHB-1406]MBD2579074.1 hypothetical protein [Oscillatoria sp. FACHB-1406]